VLDNARIHRAGKVMSHRELWEKRGLFIFFLHPYAPHLNLAETLCRILKGKWIKPQDYISKDNLFYATDRALANVRKSLYVNLKNHAA
jgi:transposase